jgi:lysophospholipase L1-like esterase
MRTTAAGQPAPAKRLIFVCATLIFLVVAAAAVAEVAYRIFTPRQEVFDLTGLHEFRPDREWLYGPRPGIETELFGTHYRINTDGFRGPRHPRSRPPGGLRILVLGDSIAFGFGVREEETFPRVLETLLAKIATEGTVEVINLGVGGYNTWNEARLLEDIGVEYQPDLVMVQFSINDLNDPTNHFGAQTNLVFGAIPDAAFPNPARSMGVASTHMALVRTCHLSELCGALHQRIANRREPRPITLDSARATATPVENTDRVEWRWLEERYQEMSQTAAGVGARFAILAFPYRDQVRGVGPHPVAMQLASLARRNDWILVNPLGAFRRARRQNEHLFLDLWHPTIVGHRIAAAEALHELTCSGPLDDHEGPSFDTAHCRSQRAKPKVK